MKNTRNMVIFQSINCSFFNKLMNIVCKHDDLSYVWKSWMIKDAGTRSNNRSMNGIARPSISSIHTHRLLIIESLCSPSKDGHTQFVDIYLSYRCIIYYGSLSLWRQNWAKTGWNLCVVLEKSKQYNTTDDKKTSREHSVHQRNDYIPVSPRRWLSKSAGVRPIIKNLYIVEFQIMMIMMMMTKMKMTYLASIQKLSKKSNVRLRIAVLSFYIVEIGDF